LQRVLKAYSVYDKSVGYCQGMGFLTGLFLMYTNEEEDAFWMLHELLWGQRLNFHGLYSPHLPLTHQCLFQFDALLKKHCPLLHAHLTKHEIRTDLYATQWFMTFFIANFNAHFEVVLRIIDIVLFEGIKIVFRVGLYLLKHLEKRLLTLDFADLVVNLKKFEDVEILRDADRVIRGALKISISSSELKLLAKQWRKDGAKIIEHFVPGGIRLQMSKPTK